MSEYKFAPVYDLIVSPYIKKVRRKVLYICQEYNFKTILDVCCGTGNQVRILKNHGFDAMGVDLNEDMLRQSGRGFITPPCQKQDAAAMDLPDNSFDMATTTLALHETEQDIARNIVKEMIRVTRPGGYLILIDYEISDRTSKFSHRFVHYVESFVGGDHFRNFKTYRSVGGLDNLTDGPMLSLKDEILFRRHGLVLKLLEVSG